MNTDTLCVSCMEDDSGSPTCPKCGALFQVPYTNTQQLAPRTILREQYLIGRALGQGGFGITYLAWDTGLRIRLAIKEYMPSGVAGRTTPSAAVHAFSERIKDEYEWGLERFMEEARVLRKFSTHPNIVSVDTVFRENGTAYMVMEYLDGMTFEEFLAKRGGKVALETSLRIMLPVMDALAAVHAEGILHRDISPDNIHLAKTGKVKLMDFGAARSALSQKSRNLSVILKEGYAPEEQYRSSGIQGPWTDVYATAATLYHSITGKLPPPALDRAAEDRLEKPSQLGIEISADSERALLKALSIRAIDRFQSMEDFRGALTAADTATMVPGQPSGEATQGMVAPPPIPPPLIPVTPVPVTKAAPPVIPVAKTPPMAPPSYTPSPSYTPPPQPQSYPPPVSRIQAPKSSFPKWLIPVIVVVLVVLAGGAAVTFKYGPDIMAKLSNQQEAEKPRQPDASQTPQVSQQPAAPQPTTPDPPAESKRPAGEKANPPLTPAPAPADAAPRRQAPEQALRRADPASAPRIAPATPPPTATSGVLHYAGPPVPFNGKVTFENLPGGRLRFTFDRGAWQPVIQHQPNGTQTLILQSLKQGMQSQCDVQWEIVR